MSNNIIKRTWKQGGLVNIEDLRGSAFQAEDGGHTFLISGLDENGDALALSGTPAGVLLRADGQDVTLTCSVSDGVVSATLPANAYVVPGRIGITIFLTNGGQKTAIYAAVGSVATTSSGIVAPPAGSDVVDLVNAIATAVATIPASYTDLMAAVAPTYSTSALYAVGSYAWYSGKLYRCTTAITSGETWTSAHWTQANLGSDVSDLKSALNKIADKMPVDKSGIFSNKSISANGEISDSSTRLLTNLFRANIGDTFSVPVGYDFRVASYSNGVFQNTGNWITSWELTSNVASLYDKFRINVRNSVDTSAVISPSDVDYTTTVADLASYAGVASVEYVDSAASEAEDGIEEVKADLVQITDYVHGNNYFDPASAVVNQAGTALTSGKIPAVVGDVFYYSFTNNLSTGLVASSMYFVREFAEDDTQLKQSSYYVEGYEVTEEQTAYIRVYLQQVPISNYFYMLEKDKQTLEYEPYFAPYYTANDMRARNMIDGLQVRTETLEEDMQSVGLAESLVYPDKIYGVVGHQINIYYENAIQYGTMDTIAKCDIGGSLAGTERFRDRLIWTPTSSGSTAETISLWKSNTKNVALSTNVSFIAAPTDAGSGEIKVLVIGDSKVAYGQPTGYMKQLFANDSLTLTLLGSRYGNNNTGDVTNRHEGRGGWSAYDYCNRATKNNIVNPFYNETATDGSHFDFAKYMTDQGYSGVDYVIINLGTNDFGQTAYVYRLCISEIVESIHRYNSNVKIILGLFEGVYKPKLEWASRNEAYMTYRKALIDYFSEKEEENIWLNPMYLSMSLYDDFPMTNVPLSYADEFVQDGKTREYCSDGIHQNNAGFYKNAVSMYAILKCIEAEMV